MHTGRVHQLPDNATFVRVTPTFDSTTVPAGLLKAHRVAAGAWGRLVVHTGMVRLVFEASADAVVDVDAGGVAVIPPELLHHVELGDGATFAVEFHRVD